MKERWGTIIVGCVLVSCIYGWYVSYDNVELARELSGENEEAFEVARGVSVVSMQFDPQPLIAAQKGDERMEFNIHHLCTFVDAHDNVLRMDYIRGGQLLDITYEQDGASRMARHVVIVTEEAA